MNYWLLKTEPTVFSYADLEHLGRDVWNGVKNFTALKHLNAMQPGDLAFIYHTGKEKAIVGVAEVVSLPYPDPTESDARLLVADVIPRYPFRKPVTLAQVKADPIFAEWELVRLSRLSIMPVSAEHWRLLHTWGETPLP